MFSKTRERFGTAGLVVAVIALIVAVGGTAIAAIPGLNSKQKKEVTKIAKRHAGKQGPTGPQGPAGTPGSPGPAGANGKDGAKGATGPAGPTGNAGSTGATGSPWVPDNTLPSGAKLTGTWSMGATFEEEKEQNPGPAPQTVPISFPIPLEEALEASEVHYIAANGKEILPGLTITEVDPTSCGSGLLPVGTAEDPRAAPGHLCIYAGFESQLGSEKGFPVITKATGFFDGGASPSGAVLYLFKLGNQAVAKGTFAVTAE